MAQPILKMTFKKQAKVRAEILWERARAVSAYIFNNKTRYFDATVKFGAKKIQLEASRHNPKDISDIELRPAFMGHYRVHTIDASDSEREQFGRESHTVLSPLGGMCATGNGSENILLERIKAAAGEVVTLLEEAGMNLIIYPEMWLGADHGECPPHITFK